MPDSVVVQYALICVEDLATVNVVETISQTRWGTPVTVSPLVSASSDAAAAAAGLNVGDVYVLTGTPLKLRTRMT